MTHLDMSEVFNDALLDAAKERVALMIRVASDSAIAGDSDDEIVKRAREGLREFAKGANLLSEAVAIEFPISTPGA